MLFRTHGPGGLVAIALAMPGAGCGTSFSIETNGQPEHISGAHSTLATRGAVQFLDVCGEFPQVLFASDSGGSVCVTLGLDAASLAALHTPVTLTVSGSGIRGVDASGVAGAAFSPDATNSPAVVTLWMHHDCDCSNPPDQTFHGTVTLDAAGAQHVAGSLVLDVTESDTTFATSFMDHVQAHFDASE